MKWLRYLRYVLRHKWYVFWACVRYRIFWRGIVHDLSKFRPSEFFPYAQHFYGPKPQKRDPTGYYKPTNTGDAAFDYAWLLHQKRNWHHWQWWILVNDEDPKLCIPMSETATVEMICDWIGAGKAQGALSIHGWYEKNGGKMILHPESRRCVEILLANERAAAVPPKGSDGDKRG